MMNLSKEQLSALRTLGALIDEELDSAEAHNSDGFLRAELRVLIEGKPYLATICIKTGEVLSVEPIPVHEL
jgi:hypothetical protein